MTNNGIIIILFLSLLLQYDYCYSYGVDATSPIPSKTISIQYYSHASPATIVVPPAYPASLSNFGSIAVINATLTQDISLTSKSLGYLRGMELRTDPSSSNSTFMALWTITYDDGHYSGSIQVHGQNLLLSVTGGTGSFTGVRGILNSTSVGTDDVGFVFHHALRLSPLPLKPFLKF